MRIRDVLQSAAPILAAGWLVVLVAGCGGGGEGVQGIRGSELERLRADPRVVALEGIAERADTLLIPSLHSRLTITAAGETYSETLTERMTCSGDRCRGSEGTDVTIADLLDPSSETFLRDVSFATRRGFDTVTTQSGFESRSLDPGVSFDNIPDMREYGLWGRYGYAAVGVLDGAIAGQAEGERFRGTMRFAGALALGDTSGTNPGGVGGARWSGIAEAASTRTFERRSGNASVTIPDLEHPRVTVEIDIEGFDIGSSTWSGMSISSGGFGTRPLGDSSIEAITGLSDYLRGTFHGPNHEEVYGVFHTGAYVGAFGAKRDESGGDEL